MIRRMAKTYTVNEAAGKLSVSPGRVRQMIVDGLLKTTRFGNVHVISAEALEAAKGRKTKPGPAPKSASNGAAGKKRSKK
jgi:excisionase family DNA binding protein